MRKRPLLTASLAVLIAASMAAIGLVAVPGVSQAAAKHAKKTPLLYLSLGDSYSVGYQPPNGTFAGGATAGYTAYVAKKAKMTLENFGCGGATTMSIITAIGCTESGYGPVASVNPVPYPTTTQEQAALDFIQANPGKVGLVTISIGGNDVTSCAGAGDTGAIFTCIGNADASITANVTGMVSALDAALTANNDTTAKIVGLTYPDVILGDWVYPAASPNKSLAGLSVIAFHTFINPTLQSAYLSSATRGSFVNVTEAPYKLATSGSETPTTVMQKVKGYGTAPIPVSVAEICKLTYFCSLGNIHANDKGYKFIGQLIAADLGL